MAAPTTPSNYEKVLHAVEYNLKLIDNAHDYRTNGVVIDRGGDPTAFFQEWDKLWKQQLAAIYIHQGDDEDLGGVGNQCRYKHTYVLACLMEISKTQKDAGRRLDDLRNDLVWDIKRCIRADYKLQIAGAALGYDVRPGDGLRMSCIAHKVKMVVGIPDVIYPQARFDCVMEFEDNENIDASV